MAGKKIFSICGMCTVRCPIQVEVAGDKIFSKAIPMPRGWREPSAPGGARGWPSLKMTNGRNIP